MGNKAIVVKLQFGKARDQLWTTSCKNFIKDQSERFELLEGRKCLTGTMFFCNSYLEAVFVRALEHGTCILWDMSQEQFVVICK